MYVDIERQNREASIREKNHKYSTVNWRVTRRSNYT